MVWSESWIFAVTLAQKVHPILIFIGMAFLIVAVGIWTFVRALMGGGSRKDILHR